jgi:hypothetical protein
MSTQQKRNRFLNASQSHVSGYKRKPKGEWGCTPSTPCPHAESEMIFAGAGILEEPTHLLAQTKPEAHERRRLPLAVSSFLSRYRLLRAFPSSLSREEALREIGSALQAAFQLRLAEIVDQSLE